MAIDVIEFFVPYTGCRINHRNQNKCILKLVKSKNSCTSELRVRYKNQETRVRVLKN